MKILKFSTLLFSLVFIDSTLRPKIFDIAAEEGVEPNFSGGSIFDLEEAREKIVTVKSPKSSYDRLVQQIQTSDPDAIKIPSNLLETYSALKQISRAVIADYSPDIIDIIFLLDANGKTQCVAITKFLAKLEESLEKRFAEKYPGLGLTLSFPVDAFVGAGSGAIPAALAALGKRLPDCIEDISSLPSKITKPGISHCLGCCIRTAKDFVSAYLGKDPVVIDNDDPDWDKLTVDSFDIGKTGGLKFSNLFGSYSKNDLHSNFEVISLPTSPCILDMVNSAITARHLDTKKKLKRVIIADALEIASSLFESVEKSGDSKILQKITAANSAVNFLKKVNFVSLSDNPNFGSMAELKSLLASGSKIKRNLIIVSLTADTASEIPGLSFSKPIMTSFSNSVKYSPNDLKIVTFNYKFAIPSYMYGQNYAPAINSSIDSLFPNEEEVVRKSSAVVATSMLLDFLEICNEKALSSMENDDSIQMPLKAKEEESQETT